MNTITLTKAEIKQADPVAGSLWVSSRGSIYMLVSGRSKDQWHLICLETGVAAAFGAYTPRLLISAYNLTPVPAGSKLTIET